MKRTFACLIVALTFCFCAPAFAAPPTTAQVERLLQAMDAEKMIDQMIPVLMNQSRGMVEQHMASEGLDSAAERERATRMMDSQERNLREMMAWKNLKPIYLRVYGGTLSAEEVEAMTAFYASPEGRSVMQKLPQIMQRTMVEMQPLMQSAMQKMMDEMQAELRRK